jgi:hypothetical protein
MSETYLMPKCDNCSASGAPVYYDLNGTTLECPTCSDVYKTGFTEVDGVELSNDSLTFSAEPEDQVYLAVIKENDEGEVINIVRQRVLTTPYTGGAKDIDHYEITSNHQVKIYYEAA